MRTLAAAFLVTIMGCASLWYATDGLQAVTSEGKRRVSVARLQPAVPDVILETMSGSTTSLARGNGRFTLVEFIYTRCPTICRTAGTELARLRDRIQVQNLQERIRILSVSFDPEHDGISELSSYGKTHGADGKVWTVARPSTTDLEKLLSAFGVMVIPDKFGGFEHNAALLIINPAGRLVSILDVDDIEGALAAVRGALS